MLLSSPYPLPILRVEIPLLVQPLVRVRAEVVAEGLDEVRGEGVAAVGVVVGEGLWMRPYRTAITPNGS